jgi:uracil-DNA glycosylase family protein
MTARRSAPRLETIEGLRAEASRCTACPLYRDATQTVFGEGAVHASLMLVGEQPGDREDRSGEPFVGPAGRVLDEALEMAGIERDRIYVTNAVKHFKWEPRGKARIHKKPTAGEITACHPWLEQELAAVRPRVVVALGATAARSLFGKPVKIGEARGALLHPDGLDVVVTIHPSAILRTREADERDQMRSAFVADLRLANHEAEKRVTSQR